MKHFKTLSSYFNYLELPPPEHPMISVLTAFDDHYLPCPKENSPPIINDCYSISLKKVTGGSLNYGRTKYDFSNGTLFFLAPRQVIQWNTQAVFKQKGFTINFHEDFLLDTELAEQIDKYGFFSYSVHEALHLSPKEEKQIETIVKNIELEYHNNQDRFSKDIIISQLGILLKYANRYYERQFLNRKELTHDLLSKLKNELDQYYTTGQFSAQGIPSIERLAESLQVSQRYLSDTLKKITGKSTSEHLQYYLIKKAKNDLLNPDKSIAEVAYELGFEYPQYFSRLFKNREGMSPSQYREKHKPQV